MGYPSSSAAACTGYLSKLYPDVFKSNYNYVLIETKNVGLTLYIRLIYTFGKQAFRATIKLTFSVDNSQTLNSWETVVYVAPESNYGYGNSFAYNYGVDTVKYLYNLANATNTKTNVSKTTSTTTDDVISTPTTGNSLTTPSGTASAIASTDNHCCSWDSDNVCTACSGDYSLKEGVCNRVSSTCTNWDERGSCTSCLQGYTPSPFGGACLINFFNF